MTEHDQGTPPTQSEQDAVDHETEARDELRVITTMPRQYGTQHATDVFHLPPDLVEHVDAEAAAQAEAVGAQLGRLRVTPVDSHGVPTGPSEQRADALDKLGVIRQNGYTVETLHEAGGDGLRTVSVSVTSPEGRGATAIRSYFGSVETTGQLAAGDAFDDAMRLLAVAAGVEPWTPEVVK